MDLKVSSTDGNPSFPKVLLKYIILESDYLSSTRMIFLPSLIFRISSTWSSLFTMFTSHDSQISVRPHFWTSPKYLPRSLAIYFVHSVVVTYFNGLLWMYLHSKRTYNCATRLKGGSLPIVLSFQINKLGSSSNSPDKRLWFFPIL